MAGKLTTGLVRQSRLAVNVAGSANVPLTEAQAENGILEFTGALTGNINVTVPDATAAGNASWLIYNNTTGAFTLTFKPVTGSGVAVTQGRKTRAYFDGTNMVAAEGYPVVVDGWWDDDLTGTGGPTALVRFGAGAAFPNAFIGTRPGSITGIIVKSNEARTAGTATFEVTKNGTGTGLTAVLDGTNTTLKASNQAPGTDTFVAGDEIGVTITTAGWTPTTADIRVAVEVEY